MPSMRTESLLHCMHTGMWELLVMNSSRCVSTVSCVDNFVDELRVAQNPQLMVRMVGTCSGHTTGTAPLCSDAALAEAPLFPVSLKKRKLHVLLWIVGDCLCDFRKSTFGTWSTIDDTVKASPRVLVNVRHLGTCTVPLQLLETKAHVTA